MIQNSFPIQIVNGDSGDSESSPSHITARPKNSSTPKPLTSQPDSSVGKKRKVGKCPLDFYDDFLIVTTNLKFRICYSLNFP